MRLAELAVLLGAASVFPYLVRRIEDRVSPRAQIMLYAAGLAAVVSSVLAVLLVAMAPETLDAENIVEVLRACFGALSTIVGHPAAHIPALLAAATLLLLAVRFALTFARLTAASCATRRNSIRRAEPAAAELLPHEWRSRALVTSQEEPVAYVAGFISATIFVSTGLLTSLDINEQRAALAHEWAHLQRRHHLLLLVGTSIGRTLSPLPPAGACIGGMRRGIEARADDQAADDISPTVVASAITKSALGPAVGAVAIAQSDTVWRVRRLLEPRHGPTRIAPGLLLLALLIVLSTLLVTAARASTLIATAQQAAHHCRLPG